MHAGELPCSQQHPHLSESLRWQLRLTGGPEAPKVLHGGCPHVARAVPENSQRPQQVGQLHSGSRSQQITALRPASASDLLLPLGRQLRTGCHP